MWAHWQHKVGQHRQLKQGRDTAWRDRNHKPLGHGATAHEPHPNPELSGGIGVAALVAASWRDATVLMGVVMEDAQWARLRADENYLLRRGAWYRVAEVQADAVVVETSRKRISVPLAAVEVVGGRPRRWTVMVRPRDAIRIPKGWGDVYAVCPSCRHRVPPIVGAAKMRCPRCAGVFPIDWEQAPPSARTTPRPGEVWRPRDG